MMPLNPEQAFHLMPGPRTPRGRKTAGIILTVARICEELGVNERTVRRWIASEKLTAWWTGGEYRVTRGALTAFLNRRQGPAGKRKRQRRRSRRQPLGQYRTAERSAA